MSWWQAVVLGLVEGVTEFLPVSSTGHLLLAQRVLGIPETDASNAYAICIQAGAIVAVLLVFRERIARIVRGIAGQDADGRRLGGLVVLAFLPAAVLGPVLDHPIERVLFGLWPIVLAWAVGGVGIVGFTRWNEGRAGASLETLDARGALIIGLAQCVAMWPGTSRSLVTIVAACLVGLSLPAAVEFSFLLGLITLGAATAFKAVKHTDDMLDAYGAVPIVVGFVVAAISAFAAVRWLLAWLEQHGLGLFAGWRLGIALLVAGLLLGGMLTP
jgi:undecaprenyl-diphosphatase